MVLVSSAAPNRLAKVAANGAAKNTQTCAPFPERDRSSAAGTLHSRQESTNEEVSMSSDRSPPRGTSRFRCAAKDRRRSWSFRKDDREWLDRSAAEVVVWPYLASSTRILKLRAKRSSREC